jgi:hypothetical protein
MKGGEGEGAYRATFFACLQELLGGNSPLTGVDKTLVVTRIRDAQFE